jgi:hypothetical protein
MGQLDGGLGYGLDLKQGYSLPSHRLNDNDAMMYICKYYLCMTTCKVGVCSMFSRWHEGQLGFPGFVMDTFAGLIPISWVGHVGQVAVLETGTRLWMMLT